MYKSYTRKAIRVFHFQPMLKKLKEMMIILLINMRQPFKRKFQNMETGVKY